jgi:hypothetical protein
MFRRLVLAVMLVCLSPFAAQSGDSALLTRKILESGPIGAGEKDMAARLAAAPADNEARFGLGMIRFAEAIEHYGQRQYRFGLRAPRNMMVPLLRFPVPQNPAPEEITYEKQREGLLALLDDLAKVEATLAPMTDNETRIVIDLNNVRFDLRGDGKPDDSETLASVIASLSMAPLAHAKPAPLEVAFDNGDAFWLRGYCHLLSASIEFMLAYDWRVTFERTGHLFYPRVAPRPFDPALQTPDSQQGSFFDNSAQIADVIALIHEIRWPLVEASRMQSAHAHLKQAIAMSRASWKAILAETDDDREWIPGPRQKNGVMSGMQVTQQQVDGWLSALNDFDAALDGTKLVAHWRFKQGFNLKKVFFEPREFDLVLWATGYGAAPYLEAGPTLSSNEWRQWQAAFGGNFLGYAFWFN